jgi:hypothetical protein
MTNQDLLTKELVKHILAIFGLAEPFNINVLGITQEKFIKSNVKIDYETGSKQFPIYSATFTDKNSTIRVMGIYLSEIGDDYEFCAVFKCDDLETYGLKLSSDDELGIFVVSRKNGNWTKASMSNKLMACAGLELLNNSGLVWKPEPIGEYLHRSLLDVVEM